MKDFKNYKILFILLIISCAHDIILEQIFKSYGILPFENKKDYGIVSNIIAALCIAPIVETIIFQYLPHKLLSFSKPLKKSGYFAFAYILISTMLFCLSHYYSLIYIAAMIFSGILLSYYFQYFFRKYDYRIAIYFITLLHFSKNLLALIDKYFLNNIL